MSKLGSREIFLILIIINFLLYYLAYMCVISPLMKKGDEYKATVDTLTTQYEDQLNTVNSKDQYLATIETLKAEKQTLFNESFPDAETENLHAYMTTISQATGVAIDSINLSQETATVTNEETGEVTETGLKNNTISVNLTGTYDGIINFVRSIENVKKTSLLTSFNLSAGTGGMASTLNYEFLTVDKGEDIVDTTLDHTFNPGAGDTRLFD